MGCEIFQIAFDCIKGSFFKYKLPYYFKYEECLKLLLHNFNEKVLSCFTCVKCFGNGDINRQIYFVLMSFFFYLMHITWRKYERVRVYTCTDKKP